MKRVFLSLAGVATLALAYLFIALPSPVYAANVTCNDGTTQAFPVSSTPEAACKNHGGPKDAAQGVNQPAVPVDPSDGSTPAENKAKASCEDGGGVYLSVALTGSNHCLTGDAAKGGVIVAYLKQILQLLSGLVGAVILLLILVAGIQYITSYGDPEKIRNAKSRLTNAIKGLVLFMIAYAILGFVIPGGIL